MLLLRSASSSLPARVWAGMTSLKLCRAVTTTSSRRWMVSWSWAVVRAIAGNAASKQTSKKIRISLVLR